MQKEQAPHLTINLLKRQGHTSLETFLKWAITGGRFLVILTETIALGAFLYRFTLDRQLIDLHDKIKAKQAIVEALKPQEATYRSLQERLADAEALDKTAPEVPKLLSSVVSFASGKVAFNSLTVTGDAIRMDVTAPSVTGLNAFVTALRGYEPIKAVSVDRIENQTSRAIFSVIISARLKKGDAPVAPKQPLQIQAD